MKSKTNSYRFLPGCCLTMALSLAAPAAAQTSKAKTTSGGAEPTAQALLKDSDRARGTSKGGLKWKVTLESWDEGNHNSIDYAIQIKGNNAIAEAVAPPRSKGDIVLFNDRNMWFYHIGNKKPVSVSARQKLAGEAANGDIASTNYYRDYDAAIVGREKVNGTDTYKLELKAKAKNVTYDGIRYWVTKADRLAVKAEFLTVSGDLFKSSAMEYKNSLNFEGKKVPFVSKVTINSALNAKNKSVMIYATPSVEEIDDGVFNVNNLVR